MKNIISKLFWITIFLIMAVSISSCDQSDNNKNPKNTTPTGTNATKSAIQAVDSSASTASAILQPSLTVVQTPPSPSPTYLVQPDTIGVSLSLSEEALSNAETIQDEHINIKEEVYFLGGFGGGSNLSCPLHSSWELPIICFDNSSVFDRQESAMFDLIGFPEEQSLEIRLFAPNGRFVTSQVIDESSTKSYWWVRGDFAITEIDGQPFLQEYFGVEDEDQNPIVFENETRLIVRFWNPVGLPEGEWRVVVESQGQTVESMFYINRENEAISTLSKLTINPLGRDGSNCDEYNVGDKFYIAGKNFLPNTEVPIGFYVRTNTLTPTGGGFDYIGIKIYGTLVQSTANGDFIFSYQIQPDDPNGYYQIATSEEMETNMYPLGPCFRINNQGVDPDSLISKTTLDTDFCPGVLPAELEVGDIASVSQDPPEPNIVREKAGKQEKRLGLIQPGEKVEVIKGPKCVDGWIWWKVKSLETGLTGWTSQGDDQYYWLIPEQ